MKWRGQSNRKQDYVAIPTNFSDSANKPKGIKCFFLRCNTRVLLYCLIFFACFGFITFKYITADISPNIYQYTEEIHIETKLNQNCLVNEPVDVVITYVNGSDPLWLETKKKYTNQKPTLTILEDIISFFANAGSDSNSANRYRDNQELKYALRSIVKNMPWIRKIFLVVAQESQIPYWLNTSDSRIEVVTHEKMYPGMFKSHLPVYSSNSIEAHLQDIPGIIQSILKTFFLKLMVQKFFHNSRLFDWKYFSGFFKFRRTISHMPQFLSKSVLEEIWQVEPFATAQEETSARKFRTDENTHMSFLYFYYWIYSGRKYLLASEFEMDQVVFVALRDGVFDEEKKKLDSLLRHRPKFVTINDEVSKPGESAAKLYQYLHQTYETFFPEKAPFEF
eukprot:snap_masked-scaffold_77-processed-gene-0.37-mRNA-1 protein AED:0.09 eAED:0.69 QI:0/0/0/1/1/1/3/0/391